MRVVSLSSLRPFGPRRGVAAMASTRCRGDGVPVRSTSPPRHRLAGRVETPRCATQVRMEEERRRRLSLVKDEEAKEAHEKETRRQHRLIAVLEEEEARARAFYEYEFQNNLRERREMKEAEQATRLFVLESKSATGSPAAWKATSECAVNLDSHAGRNTTSAARRLKSPRSRNVEMN